MEIKVINTKTIFALLMALFISSGHAENYKGDDFYLKELTVVREQISTAIKTNLYEGLPHQTFEGDLLKKELKRKDIVKYEKFPFYKTPLKLTQEDSTTLKKLVTDANTFGNFYAYDSTSPKLCGGFHPDYCVEWKINKVTVYVLVCFGCHEVKIAHPQHKVYCDINEEAYKKFVVILKKYHQNRPVKGKQP